MSASILLAWASASLGLWLSSRLLSGVRIASFVDAIWAGALLGILQWVLWWPLFLLFAIGTLGIGLLLWFITSWIISAVIIRITSGLSSRLDVRGFVPALISAFIIAGTGGLLRMFLGH